MTYVSDVTHLATSNAHNCIFAQNVWILFQTFSSLWDGTSFGTLTMATIVQKGIMQFEYIMTFTIKSNTNTPKMSQTYGLEAVQQPGRHHIETCFDEYSFRSLHIEFIESSQLKDLMNENSIIQNQYPSMHRTINVFKNTLLKVLDTFGSILDMLLCCVWLLWIQSLIVRGQLRRH